MKVKAEWAFAVSNIRPSRLFPIRHIFLTIKNVTVRGNNWRIRIRSFDPIFHLIFNENSIYFWRTVFVFRIMRETVDHLTVDVSIVNRLPTVFERIFNQLIEIIDSQLSHSHPSAYSLLLHKQSLGKLKIEKFVLSYRA